LVLGGGPRGFVVVVVVLVVVVVVVVIVVVVEVVVVVRCSIDGSETLETAVTVGASDANMASPAQFVFAYASSKLLFIVLAMLPLFRFVSTTIASRVFAASTSNCVATVLSPNILRLSCR
jgi:hypothetical protein